MNKACLIAVILLLSGWLAPVYAQDCAALGGKRIPGSELTSAESVPEGPMTVPSAGFGAPPVTVDLQSFCRVKGLASPSVGFEIWLPQRWNGRLLSVGSGGFGGSTPKAAMAEGLKQGFAVMGEDTGHQGEDRRWMSDMTKVTEWGRSSTHLATAPAKTVVADFYGKPARFSYFAGCSTGGAEAMEEAEFFPGDYDGVVAGAPGMSYLHLMLSFLWGMKAASAYPDSLIPANKLQLLHNAVLQACGSQGTSKGAVLENPLACRFDPAGLQCKGADDGGCLTPHQVQTAIAIYQGPHNPRTGAALYPGFAFGSEWDDTAANPLAGGWTAIQGPLATLFAIPLLRDMAYGDPKWDWRGFDWDKDVEALDRRLASAVTATSPDLSRFQHRGGKLIVYQGWNDPLNAQTYPIQYRAAVLAETKKASPAASSTKTVDSFMRLFMVPGLGHCAGGPGPDQLNTLAAVQAWVEHDLAPDRIVASRAPADSARSPSERVICAFPALAAESAGSQVCRIPL